jgi:(p)ppGpp synthase/HD superfamily hydrolase
MMRQYDLIERVRRYNPNTNEALLNRAYVYAMKAHGEQRRASGDPYFSHPIEVAAILTDLKLDDATIAAALLSRTPRLRARKSTVCSGVTSALWLKA